MPKMLEFIASLFRKKENNQMDLIFNFLNRSIIDSISDKKLRLNVKRWFMSIDPEDTDLKRFFICLAIDLKNDLLSSDSLIEIFKKIDFSSKISTPLQQFDTVINNNPNRFLINSNCNDLTYGKHRYSSVITWEKLFRKIREYSKVPILPDDHSTHYKIVFEDKYFNFKQIKEFGGWKGVTWIAPYEDLLNCLNNSTNDIEMVNNVIDRLGLDSSNKRIPEELHKFIYIIFPESFDIPCYQPTSLYGFWKEKGGLYLSYCRKNGYGLTYTTSGKNAPMKERVLRNNHYCNEHFSVKIIGVPDGSLKKDTAGIVAEGINRFNYGN
jgi:hypothetical protein